MAMSNNQAEINGANPLLPRSLYTSQNDPRENLRDMVNAVFSDKFMIFLSLILVPMILSPFVFDLNSAELSFIDICDWIIVILFVLEYASKLYLAKNRWQHFTSPWHIVDLIIVMLPFVQYFPFFGLAITGSPSLLLRLLRLPRALAVGGRAVAGRRNNNTLASYGEGVSPKTIIRQVDSDLKTTHNLNWDELKDHLADASRQEWVDLHNVSDEGFTSLSEILGIALPHFKSDLMDDIYPHIDYVKKSSLIFVQSGEVRYPEHADNYLTILRSGIIIICNSTKIITVSRHSVDFLNEVLASVKQSMKAGVFVVPVLYGILDRMLTDYRIILSEIELEVLKISGTHRSKLPRDFLERIYQLDKEVSRLVSNLVHFKDMLGIITSRKVPLDGFDAASEDAFHLLQEGAGYLNEVSHNLIDNLRTIINLYINQTSFETNRILKILAVITAISVIPSAIGGLMGTNLLDVPYSAYLWQLSLIIGVSMTLVTYTFIKLGWLKT
jgi:Mg2+ and Co2+ transporter CorA